MKHCGFLSDVFGSSPLLKPNETDDNHACTGKPITVMTNRSFLI